MDNTATEEMAFMPGSKAWANRVGHHDRLQDSPEFAADKEAIESKVKALIGSIEVAIARLQGQQGGKHGDSSKRILLYESALGQGQGLLAALNAGGGHQLAALSERAEAISGTFTEVADGSIPEDASGDDGNDAPAKVVKAAAASKEEMDKLIADDAFMQTLAHHHHRLHHLKVQNNALVADIASSADDGERDLKATVALAGMLANHADEKELNAFVAATYQKMTETETSLAGATKAERIALIKEQAGTIAGSMELGEAETRKGIAKATHAIMELHLGSHTAQAEQHLGESGGQMAACHVAHYCDTCSSQSAAWHAHMDETMAKLDAAVHDLGRGASGSSAPVTAGSLEGIMAGMDTDKVFRLWREQGSRSAELLEAHGTTLMEAEKAMLVTQAKLDGLMRRENSGAGDVALVLGVSKKDLLEHVAEFTAAHNSVETQIGSINSLWKEKFFHKGRGQALDAHHA